MLCSWLTFFGLISFNSGVVFFHRHHMHAPMSNYQTNVWDISADNSIPCRNWKIQVQLHVSQSEKGLYNEHHGGKKTQWNWFYKQTTAGWLKIRQVAYNAMHESHLVKTWRYTFSLSICVKWGCCRLFTARPFTLWPGQGPWLGSTLGLVQAAAFVWDRDQI